MNKRVLIIICIIIGLMFLYVYFSDEINLSDNNEQRVSYYTNYIPNEKDYIVYTCIDEMNKTYTINDIPNDGTIPTININHNCTAEMFIIDTKL